MTTGPGERPGERRSEDAAWQAIVDNYGERAVLDDEPPAPAPAPREGGPVAPVPVEPDAVVEEPEEQFVPPPVPPAPYLPWPKRLAWLGVLGSPVALVLALLFSVYLPPLLGYGLVAGFLGGFGYLVWTMQRANDRDPFDDGSRL